jgi:chromosome segregation ATPase
MGIKDENLDKPMGMIDFSLYLHDTPFLQTKAPMEMSRGSKQMAAILDQKNYLEELNRHLNATVTNLQQKLESLQTANTLMTEDITIAKSNIIQLQQENSNLRREKETLLDEHHRQMQTAQDDIDTERAAYQMSRQGLDTMYQDVQQRLQHEINHRTELERLLEEQTTKRRDLDNTLKLLEKDARAKQATVGALRKQLEDIKMINQDIGNKIRSAVEGTGADRTAKLNDLESQMAKMATVIQQMETRLAVVDKSNSKQGSTM